ncbi:MAG: T9SS type A sorting domain-containing protein [Bacteroidia bacterium]
MQSTAIPATPQITNNAGTLSIGSVTGTVQWYLNNSAIAGATSTSFTPTATGTYTVIVTNQGCSSTSAPFNLSSVGVESLISAKTHVFPNPTSGEVTVLTSIAGSANELRIEMFDLSGKLVYTRTFNGIPAGTPIQISTEGLANGIYQLMLVTPIEKQFTKIAVSR